VYTYLLRTGGPLETGARKDRARDGSVCTRHHHVTSLSLATSRYVVLVSS